MVKAIRANKKKMTRRIVTDDVSVNAPDVILGGLTDNDIFAHFSTKNSLTFFAGFVSKYKIGDRLWVRETFAKVSDRYVYKADVESDFDKPKEGWKPSIHMPKEASRLWMEVTEIKVERLNDITAEDAIAEGVESLGLYPNYDFTNKVKFGALWNSIYGFEAWDKNPWVWCYSFKQIEK